jgi:hypothetical protein
MDRQFNLRAYYLLKPRRGEAEERRYLRYLGRKFQGKLGLKTIF